MLKVIYQPKGRAAEYSTWAANLYRGCGHNCLYCYAPSALQMDRVVFSTPVPRVGIISKLTKDCAELRAQNRGEHILLCFSCDPYQPLNDDLGLTRQAIEVLHFYGQAITVLTKGGRRALADMPLLKAGDEFAVTLTCLEAGLSRQWEPGAALPQERIDTLREASARGIRTWISLEPVLYPEQSLAIIEQTHEFVDKYKLGVLNYHPHARTIDWRAYGERAITLLKSRGKCYYIKDDLRKYLTI